MKLKKIKMLVKNLESLKNFKNRSYFIKNELNIFNDFDELNKFIIICNEYFDKYESFSLIDEFNEYSKQFNIIKNQLKKIDLPKKIISDFNLIINKIIEFNNDLIMSIIMLNI